MKKLSYFIPVILMFFLLGNTNPVFSQDNSPVNVFDFMSAGEDASPLFESYLEPFGKSTAIAMGGGWYNTGKVHKLFGFDLTMTVNVVSVPDADHIFQLGDLDFAALEGTGEAPTISGPLKDDQPELVLSQDIDGQEYELARFNTPPGIGLRSIPMPTANLSFGLPFNTDISVRYVPQINIGDVGKIGLWGIGFKHDVKQWIPVVKKLPFDFSLMGGHTRFSTSYADDLFTLDDLNSFSPQEFDKPDNIDFNNQEMVIGVNSTTFNLILSKKLPIVTPYVSAGFVKSKFYTKVNGNFPIPSADLDEDNNIIVTAEEDPIDFGIDYNNFNVSAGLRLQFAIFTLHAQYTKQDYSMISGGVGISFR